jgi:hypothetical protein
MIKSLYNIYISIQFGEIIWYWYLHESFVNKKDYNFGHIVSLYNERNHLQHTITIVEGWSKFVFATHF